METPVDGNASATEVGKRVIDKPELPTAGIYTDNEVYTEVVEAQLKRGTFDGFEVFSDESPRIGGTEKYPTPMTYLAMATGF
jgi:hypothetical protein